MQHSVTDNTNASGVVICGPVVGKYLGSQKFSLDQTQRNFTASGLQSPRTEKLTRRDTHSRQACDAALNFLLSKRSRAAFRSGVPKQVELSLKDNGHLVISGYGRTKAFGELLKVDLKQVNGLSLDRRKRVDNFALSSDKGDTTFVHGFQLDSRLPRCLEMVEAIKRESNLTLAFPPPTSTNHTAQPIPDTTPSTSTTPGVEFQEATSGVEFKEELQKMSSHIQARLDKIASAVQQLQDEFGSLSVSLQPQQRELQQQMEAQHRINQQQLQLQIQQLQQQQIEFQQQQLVQQQQQFQQLQTLLKQQPTQHPQLAPQVSPQQPQQQDESIVSSQSPLSSSNPLHDSSSSRIHNSTSQQIHIAPSETPHRSPIPHKGRVWEMVERIELKKRASDLGIVVRTDTKRNQNRGTSVYISEVLPGSVAEAAGRFSVDDRVLEVGGIPLPNNATQEDVLALLKSFPENQRMSLIVSRVPQIEPEETLTVLLNDNESGLGLCVLGGIDQPVEQGNFGLFISDILPGGAAAASGQVRIGDQIIEVSGTPLQGFTHAQAVEILRSAARPIQLKLCRTSDVSFLSSILSSRSPTPLGHSTIIEETLEVNIPYEKGSLGLCVAGGVDRSMSEKETVAVHITHIVKNSAAAKHGALRVGDRIISVNGVQVEGLTYDEVLRALVSQEDEAKIVVGRMVPHQENVLEIKINKGPEGFGFAFYGGTDNAEHGDAAIFVTNIEEGGAASMDGRLKCGDKIVGANGKSLIGATHEEAMNVLKEKDLLELTVTRPTSPVPNLELVIPLTFKPPQMGGEYGFSIAGGNDAPVQGNDPGVYVTDVSADSVAAACGFRFGDRLIAYGSCDMTNISHADAVEALKQSSAHESINVLVARLPKVGDDGEYILQIDFSRTENCGLGLSVAGGTDQPVTADDNNIYVTGVLEGGAAAQDARIAVGDKVLVANGHPMQGLTHAEAVKYLLSNPNSVRLTVSRLAEDVV
eukprot:m.4456 g.4456  ORF g.4456 m.4456 type:complete len:981 (-) comp2991_c0_seq1:228-3170(-)